MIARKTADLNNIRIRAFRKRQIPKRGFWIIAIVAIVSMILVVRLYSSPLLIVAEHLTVDEFQFDGVGYGAKVLDIGGNELAYAYLRVPAEVSTSPTRIRFSIWHAEGTSLDSLALDFSSDDMFLVSLIAPEGDPWPSMVFHEASDGKGVNLDIPSLERKGEGPLTLDFFLQRYADHLDLDIHVKFSLHKRPPFSLTRYTADSSLNVARTCASFLPCGT